MTRRRDRILHSHLLWATLANNGTHLRRTCQAKGLRSSKDCRTMPLAIMRKDDRIGVRVPAELKRVLIQISKKEGRSLAQLCEILLRGGATAYQDEGSKYLQRLLSRQKKEGSSE